MVKIWTSNARGVGSIPDQGTKIPHAAWCGKKKKKKRKKAKKERDREESEALAEKREQNSVFFSETGGRKD